MKLPPPVDDRVKKKVIENYTHTINFDNGLGTMHGWYNWLNTSMWSVVRTIEEERRG